MSVLVLAAAIIAFTAIHGCITSETRYRLYGVKAGMALDKVRKRLGHESHFVKAGPRTYRAFSLFPDTTAKYAGYRSTYIVVTENERVLEWGEYADYFHPQIWVLKEGVADGPEVVFTGRLQPHPTLTVSPTNPVPCINISPTEVFQGALKTNELLVLTHRLPDLIIGQLHGKICVVTAVPAEEAEQDRGVTYRIIRILDKARLAE